MSDGITDMYREMNEETVTKKMIYRVEHSRANPYTPITNTTLQDNRLSFAAIGLLSYMLSFPDNWEFHVTEIANRRDTSKYEVRKLLTELAIFGYVEAYSERDKNGRIYKGRYVVHEVPQPKLSATNTLEINEFLA